MNSTKKNSEFGGVKKKLTAAIAMLLVATIMMVSSTYAWFTLSTAPEVTGITTSVGANGNLEMMLVTAKAAYDDPDSVTSQPGDSVKDVTQRNATWGNLVELNDPSYGLTNIKLLPSRMNVITDKINSQMTGVISVAEYGSDGRVTQLSKSTVSGTYTTKTGDTANAKAFLVNENYGVRALGTASGMSQQQLAYRNAQGYMGTYTIQAKTYAQQSLTLYGSQLANIAVQHATVQDGQTDNTVYSADDVAAINGMLTELTKSRDAIEKALMYAVLAQTASKANTATGDANKYGDVQAAIEAPNATLSTVEGVVGAVVPTSEGYTKAKADLEALTTGDNAIPEPIGTKDEYHWDDIKDVVSKLVNTNELQLNGVKVASVKSEINKIINDVLGGKGLTLSMGAGSGVYDYIARAVGDYAASVTIKEISYGEGNSKITANNVKATMTTSCGENPAHLVATLTAVVNAGAPEQDASEDKTITDTYAYAIDMAFRTNASSAKLQLQTEAAQRIYDGSTVQDTQGSGSNFTFTLGTNYTEATAKKLAECINIVFVDSEGNVLGVAGLDTGDGWKRTGTEYKANIVMKDATFDADGVITVTGNKDDATITTLTQNKGTTITAYVYLNGDKADNTVVAANGGISMVGSLNLQFSTDQTLTPMDYTPLQQSGSTGTNG